MKRALIPSSLNVKLIAAKYINVGTTNDPQWLREASQQLYPSTQSLVTSREIVLYSPVPSPYSIISHILPLVRMFREFAYEIKGRDDFRDGSLIKGQKGKISPTCLQITFTDSSLAYRISFSKKIVAFIPISNLQPLILDLAEKSHHYSVHSIKQHSSHHKP